MALAMRRKVVLVCLLLAVVQRTVGQSLSIGSDLPCEQSGEDPDPNNDRDNLSCPTLIGVMQCYSRATLCDGTELCADGSDEGTNLGALECTGPMFTCVPGEVIDVIRLCDGNRDCTNGDDETTTLCENKCLLPYYGGCSYTRECMSLVFNVNCGGCLDGFGERDPEVDDCSVQIQLENSTYTASEVDELSEEICAVIIAASNPDINLANTLIEIGITTIVGAITPRQVGGANAATATADFDPQAMAVTLSLSQPRDCIQVAIVNDNIPDPSEVFEVVLTTNAANAIVLDGGDSATVTIIDNQILMLVGLSQTAYDVSEGVREVEVCASRLGDMSCLESGFSLNIRSEADSAEQSKDFEAVFSTLSFDRCDLEKCINVQIIDDGRVERNESFKIFLEWDSAQDSILEPNSANGTITIQDNDVAVVGLEKTYYLVSENTIGDIEICVTVKGSSVECPIEFPFAVNLTAIDGTAVAPMDYSPNTPVTLEFEKCESIKLCHCIDIMEDTILESIETFSVTLEKDSGLDENRITLDPVNGQVDIIDNMNLPELVTFLSVSVSGNCAVVCVEAEDDATVKIILTDVTDQCHITNFRDSSGCSTFNGLPAGRHGVRVFIDNNKVKSGFFYFTTE